MASLGSRLGTSTTQDWMLLGALALAGYVVYNIVKGIKTTADTAESIARTANAAGQQVVNSVASGLAKIYTLATLPPNIVPTGAVVLPNGLVVPASQIQQLNFDSSQNLAFFNYQGIDYQIAPQQWDAHGNLLASEVPDFGLIPNATGGWS